MKLSVEIPEKIYSRGVGCDYVPPNENVLIFRDKSGECIYSCPAPESPVNMDYALLEFDLIRKVQDADVISDDDGVGWNSSVIERLDQRRMSIRSKFKKDEPFFDNKSVEWQGKE